MATSEIKGLKFNISASQSKAITSLEKLATAMNKTKKGGVTLAAQIKKVADAINNFDDAGIKKLQKLANAFEKLNENGHINLKIAGSKGVGSKLATVTNDLEKRQEELTSRVSVQDVMPSEQSMNLANEKVNEEVKKTRELTRQLEFSYKGLFTTINAVSEKGNLETTIKRTIDLSKILSTSIKGIEFAFKKTWQLGITGAKGLFSVLKVGLNQATQGIRGFFKTFDNIRKRIGSILLRRVITSILRTIWSSIGEGIENMYQFSLVARQSFVGAMNTMSTSALYLKNTLGAALAPAIEALAPIIDFIVDKFVALINIINQVISFITGKAFWTKATKQAKAFGTATGGAGSGVKKVGDEAEEAKEKLDLFLASFDELHLTDAPDLDTDKDKNSPGSGGGGGAGGDNYSTMFENVDFDSDLKTLLENGDWYGIGSLFANKLNVLTVSADNWILDTFSPWAKTFGTNLGNTINGFVDKYDWELLGKTIGDGVNGAIGGLNDFLETTNFSAIGEGIGRTIKSWFDKVNWDEIGTYFANKFNAVIHFFEGMVTKIFGGNNGIQIGNKLSSAIRTWIDKVDWDAVGNTIVTGFNGAIDTFSTVINNNETWSKLKSSLDKIFSRLDEIDIKSLAESLSSAFVNAMNLVDWGTVGETIGRFVGNLKWGEIVKTILSTGWEMMKGALRGFFQGEHAAELATIIVGLLAAKIGTTILETGISMKITSVAIANGIGGAIGGAVGSKTGIGAIASALGLGAASLAVVGGALVLTLTVVTNIAKGNNTMTNNGEFSNPMEKYEAQAKSWKEFFGIKDEKIEVDISLNKPSASETKKVLNSISKDVTKGKKIEKLIELLVPTNVRNVLTKVASLVTKDPTKISRTLELLKPFNSAITQVLNNTANDVKNNSVKLNKNINPVKAIPSVISSALTGTAADVKSYGITLDKNINPIKALASVIKVALTGTANDVKISNILLDKNINPIKATASVVKNALTGTASDVKNNSVQLVKEIILSTPTGRVISNTLDTIKSTINGYNLDKNANVTFTYPSQESVRNGVNWAINGYTPTIHANISVPHLNPQGQVVRYDMLYANGGFVDEGQLFIAREAGPELVGSIGGKTAVANNEQIVSAVAQGVASAVSGVLGSGGNQSLTVYLDGEVVYNNVVQRNNNHVARTGNSELLV